MALLSAPLVVPQHGLEGLYPWLSASASSTASILFPGMNAHIFSYLLSSEQIPQKLAILMTSLDHQPHHHHVPHRDRAADRRLLPDNAVAVILLTPSSSTWFRP
ncbi:MAG: hypothetical protein ACLUS6_04345 [Dysosmobacter sp.]